MKGYFLGGRSLIRVIIRRVFTEPPDKVIQNPIDLTGRKYYGFRQRGCLAQFNAGEPDKLTL
jgi:hypothetical protein